jgi:hypothetical protein
MYKIAQDSNKDAMPYTLVMPNGKRIGFYIQDLAEMYQESNGGILLEHGRAMLKLVEQQAA